MRSEYRDHLIENRDADQSVTLLQREEKLQEHKESVHGELQPIDRGLLMGDHFSGSDGLTQEYRVGGDSVSLSEISNCKS